MVVDVILFTVGENDLPSPDFVIQIESEAAIKKHALFI